MKKLTQLVVGMVALCMTLAPLPSVAQVLEPVNGLAVFDANGTRVGPVVGVWSDRTPSNPLINSQNSGVWFSMKVDEITVLLAVDQNSVLYGTEVDELYFESIDCTGTPLFRTNFLYSLFLPSSTVVGGPNPGQAGGGGDNIIYVPDPGDTPTFVTTLSRTDGGMKSELCNPLGSPPTLEVIRAIPLIDIDAVFTRPFHIQEDVEPKKGGGPKK